MASAALQAFRRTVTVAWPQQQDADAKKHLVAVARAGHARIMREATARSGFAPDFDAYANRPGNANLDSVILPGPIVYRYRYLREAVVFALSALRKASPVVSGAYRNSHRVFVDGIPVDGVPAQITPGSTIMISNLVPYARRLEVGKTQSGRAFVIQVPPHIYQRVTDQVRARFRNIGSITSGYATVPPAYVIKGRLPSHYIASNGRRRRRRQAVGQPVPSPAIFFQLHA
ncbi:MAG: hypothetical protein KIS96_03485 [Bauldia sp.]|nr:hypothetical protein [Bauldia sp.]